MLVIGDVYTPEGTFKAKALVVASGAMGRPASFKVRLNSSEEGSYCATCDGAFIEIVKSPLLVSIKRQLKKQMFLQFAPKFIG